MKRFIKGVIADYLSEFEFWVCVLIFTLITYTGIAIIIGTKAVPYMLLLFFITNILVPLVILTPSNIKKPLFVKRAMELGKRMKEED